MLTSLRLRNFKSFADAQASFGPLTLLAGANASGKSNVLDALRLLRGLSVEMLSLDRALQGVPREWPGIRGGLHEVVRSGANAFALESTWRVPSAEMAGAARTLEYSIECTVSPNPLVRRERLQEAGRRFPIFEVEAPVEIEVEGIRQLEQRVSQWGDDASTPEKTYRRRAGADMRSSELLSWPVFSPRSERIKEAVRRLKETLERIQLLDVVPAAMREYVPQAMQELGESGENLSAILWQLCQDAAQKKGWVDWLAELCSPELADIDFSVTDEGDVMLRLVEKDGSRVSARSLSDGTLRFLAELVALRTAPEGSVILLEELGRELHPSRVHLLVEYLESITEQRGVQVIATTHSPLVLEALGPQARDNVVALGHVPGQPGTVMKRVGDLPRFQEVVERRGLGYLFTTHWLEQAL